MTRRRLPAALLAIASAAGCSSEKIDPLTSGLSEDAGTPADAGLDAKPDPGPVVRTIEQRNPFGNVAEHENLLWDGDFEWSSPFADQYGWINYPASSQAFGFEGIRVGVECRSGLKCVAVKKGASIIGIAVASKTGSLSASFWAKPAEPSCDGISARLIALAVADPGVEIVETTDAPDASGWCRFEVVADKQQSKSYFLIKNQTQGELLVDDAVLKKVPPTQTLSLGTARPPTAAEMAEDAEVRAEARTRRGPHDAPPNAAQRAFEAWARR